MFAWAAAHFHEPRAAGRKRKVPAMVKSALRKALNRFAAATGWSAVRKPRPLWTQPESELFPTLDLVLAHYTQSNAEPFCLQIGAFDGVTGDPIYPLVEKYSLRGILVEPQAPAFEKLRANYSRFGDRFRLVNAAIAPADGTRPLYRIRQGAPGPDWLPQVASFDKHVVLKHKFASPDLESFLVTENVICVSFTTLLREYADQQIEVLQIDAEGYDAEILRMFDVRRHRPAIVHYEHMHLKRNENEPLVRELMDLGYKVAVTPFDTLAYLIR
jgi:FkbM family methyltransferase